MHSYTKTSNTRFRIRFGKTALSDSMDLQLKEIGFCIPRFPHLSFVADARPS